jgi:hypothetical protein
VRYGTVRCGAVRYGAVRYGTVRKGAVRYGTVRCGTVRFGTVRCGTVRCGTVRYGAVRYGTVRYVWNEFCRKYFCLTKEVEGGAGGKGRGERQYDRLYKYSGSERSNEIRARKAIQNVQHRALDKNCVNTPTAGRVMLQTLRVNCCSLLTAIGKTCSSEVSKNVCYLPKHVA